MMHTPNILRRSAILSAVAALLLASPAVAQVSHGGQPEGLLRPFPEPAPAVAVTPPDVATYLAEDEARGHHPLRYGALVDLDLTLEDGAWTELPDGSRAWRLRILSPGAKSLAVEFESLELPPGARMYVYHDLVEVVLGAYIDENAHHDGSFVFEPLPGDDMTIEIDVPAGVPDPSLRTKALIYDYRDVYGLMDGTVTVGSGRDDDGSDDEMHHVSGHCLIDVNCPQGLPWENQKRATMRTLSGGTLCSGALLNNTANDGAQYVLTANHCGQGTNTTFRFKYERSGCNAGSAPTGFSVSGAQVLATNSNADSRLLRITNSIPLSYEPYFAGWTRTTQNATFAFSMGHPSGGPKKISISSNGTSLETWFWRMTWNEGTLQGGSSGGPVFDQNGRVKGAACCVNNFTCSQTAWFGRFDRFWSANPIAQFLDPLGQNPTSIDGFDPLGPTCDELITSYCETSPNSVGAGAIITTTGSTSVAENNFTLVAFGLPPSQNGLFYYGENAIQVAFGNGWRCVGPGFTGTFRLPVVQADVFGEFSHHLDFTQPPANGGAGLIQGGSIWKFQAWYRDPAAGGANFNLTDAIDVTFCP